MNTKEMSNLDLAVAYKELVDATIERGLMKQCYHANALSIARHVGRMVIEVELNKDK